MRDEEIVAEVVNPNTPVQTQRQDVLDISADELVYLGEQAEKRIKAIKKVMTAALSITTPHDWVLIGGKPYLQESGTTKVASLIGISFEIAQGFPIITTDSQGYKTYTYRVRAFGKNTAVEGEGSRSMKEDFFRKRGKDKYLSPEEINERDVMIAALTNAKNNAIKSIIPGLKNIEVENLEEAGIKVERIQGYSFKEGSQGGQVKKDAFASGLKCEYCDTPVTQQVASFSQAKYRSHILCVDCQKRVQNGQLDLRTLDNNKTPNPQGQPNPQPKPQSSTPTAADFDELPNPEDR